MAEPEIVPKNCVECGKCHKQYKEKAVTVEGGFPSIDPEKCVFCGDCILGCPTGSLKAKRTGYEYEQVE